MKVCLFLVCGVGQIWFTALWSRWLRLRRQSRSSRNRQIAGLTCSWVEVSSSKMLNPKFLLMSSWHLACISVWTGEFDKCCEALWAVCRLENAVEMQVHVPSSSLLHRSVRLHQKRVISYPNDVVSTPAMALRRRPTGRTRMMTMNVLDDQVTDFFWLENSSLYEFVWQKIQGGFKPNTSQGCMRRLRFISSVTCRVVVIQPPGQTTKTWYMIKLMNSSPGKEDAPCRRLRSRLRVQIDVEERYLNLISCLTSAHPANRLRHHNFMHILQYHTLTRC